jgi:hypothetical protein
VPRYVFAQIRPGQLYGETFEQVLSCDEAAERFVFSSLRQLGFTGEPNIAPEWVPVAVGLDNLPIYNKLVWADKDSLNLIGELLFYEEKE